MKKINRQKGIALLMAIMIVALVAIISVDMITQRQLQIYRTANLYFRDQAYQFCLGIERWGISALRQDFEKDKKESRMVDTHQDIWNSVLVDFDVEQATIEGEIFDLQGRFNLNNLILDGKVQVKWMASYKRLLASLDLPVSLADTLADWIDTNEQPTGSSGAEDIYYIALQQPYRAANQPLLHLSELLLIKDYSPEVYNTLKPYVFVAKPATPVNINTSSATVLKAIIPDLSDSLADSLINQIQSKPFLSVDEFLKESAFQDKAIEASQVSVLSNFYVVNSHALIDKTKVSLQSVLNRNEQGHIQVISRQETLLYENLSRQKESE